MSAIIERLESVSGTSGQSRQTWPVLGPLNVRWGRDFSVQAEQSESDPWQFPLPVRLAAPIRTRREEGSKRVTARICLLDGAREVAESECERVR